METREGHEQFVLDGFDREALRLTTDKTIWPFSSANELFNLISDRIDDVGGIDTTTPNSLRQASLNGQIRLSRVLDDLLKGVRPYVDSVAISDEAEQFLKDNP